MRGSTHAIIGANTVWIPYLVIGTAQPWWFLVGAFAALLPDLDASESKIKHLPLKGKIGWFRFAIKPFYPIAMLFSAVFGHRGALHSLLAVAIVTVAAGFLVPYITAGGWLMLVLGYISHLLADALTKSAIELFWPMRIRIGLLPRALRVKTGGVVDTALLLSGSAGVVWFLYGIAGA